MSNMSLKEQLQALSLTSSASSSTESKKKIKKPATTTHPPKNAKQKPAWLEQAQYGVELLKAYFPACFKEIAEIKPLKVGIKQDLVKRLSNHTDIAIGDKACMVTSLAYYVNSIAYHKSVVEGAMRIDLDGAAAGAITAEEAKYSLECHKAKLQKKNKQAARVNKTEVREEVVS
jgi:ProP effector